MDIPIINSSEIGTNILASLPPELLQSASSLMNIFKAIGIAFLVYIIFLIISLLFKWRESSKLKKIANNVEEINKKMDILVKKAKKK